MRIHALTARALRETTPENQRSAAAITAANTLAAIWPNTDHTQRELAGVLRANTDTLTAHAGDSLWKPDPHLVHYLAGTSLLNAHLHSAASVYWARLAADCERLLGDEHSNTLDARTSLASSYQQAGRTNEAITIEERVLANRERILGDEHPDTRSARDALSGWRSAGDDLRRPSS